MADSNSLVIDVRAVVGPEEWDFATPSARLAVLHRVADKAWSLKIDQIAAGIGANGARLPRVKPESRPDGATGPPLSPHRSDSRARRLLRISIGLKSGRVTLWHSHGFGKILGYHKDGLVRGAPVRNVIDYHPAYRKRLDAYILDQWRIITKPKKPPPKPTPRPAPVARPPAPAPREIPAAARSAVARYPILARYVVPPARRPRARP